ncbi:hybrid sensor histidine kinase/response regulator [Solimonas flava]|uniref:hybrid sensor histidine kinase/response regulator n=1 Tax=Solimonas flava TaxID=415849 RepID=UPI00040EEAF0|nr:hybrid sensor histidine kinase/response regulator [Solimonas flava]
MREAERGYSRRLLPGAWAFLALVGIAFTVALTTWSGPMQIPPLLRTMLALSVAVAGLALALAFARTARRAFGAIGLTLRALASGRLEVRAPDDLPGLAQDLARDLNRVAQQYAELRAGFDARVAEQTLRFKRERDEYAEQNQKLRSAAAREQDEARAQSERLSSMSHELRTPLTGILGYADLLRRTPLDHEQREHLDTLDKSARALLSMINDLLDWSRIEAGRLKLDELRFDLYDVVESTIALLAPLAYEKELELVRIIYHDVPRELRGDSQRLRQILTNLLSNAIKFTPRGAVVLRVMGEREETGRTWLRFAVSDTGIGIAPDARARLFQPFRQIGGTQVGSSGLGLSISRKLAELMGGEISLDSEVGKGSTFSVLLPFKLIAAAESAPHDDEPLGEQRVWLYEPHAAARLAWLHWFEFWGLSVDSFESADALSEALFNTAVERRPALVVLGLMPRDIEQPAIAELLQRSRGTTSTVVLVNSVSPPVLEQIRQAGATLCHPKSVTRKRLYEDIARLLSDHDGTALPLAGRHALIADNNAANRRYLAALCAHLGLKTSEAVDGRDAFERWQDERPDIALIDAHMPKLDGPGCARAIRDAESGSAARCRILAVSAHLDPDERQAFLDAGADAVLIKPFDDSQLLAALAPSSQRPSHAAAKLTEDPELLALLKEELPLQFAELEKAFSAGELERAREAAHTLRGTAAFYHLAQLRQTAAAVEEWLRHADSLKKGPAARRELDSVRTAVDDTLAAMRRSA